MNYVDPVSIFVFLYDLSNQKYDVENENRIYMYSFFKTSFNCLCIHKYFFSLYDFMVM